MSKKLLAVLIATILVLTMGSTVFAEDEIPACAGDLVDGTIVDYDPDLNIVTIETEDGLCTITLSDEEQDYGHPITTLLGNYFNNLNSDKLDLEEKLAATEVCLDLVDGNYELYVPAEGEDCPYTGVVTKDNGDGTFQVKVGEEEITLTVDEDTGNNLSDALDNLKVDWNLNEDGSLEDAGDTIAALHDDGVGFGVIVKLYGIADASGVPVEDLIAEYLAGASIGDLFAKYGKPALIGVGHVRKDAKNNTTGDEDVPEEGEEVVEESGSTVLPNGKVKPSKDNKDKSNKGICNAKDKGGKANANGKGVDCGTGD